MAALDFPNSPTLNQVFTSGGTSWTYDGTKWVVSPGSGGLTDAPSDSTYYGRYNASWINVAPLASPGLTGTPTAPTAATATNTTQIATTAFVKAQSYLTANQSITLSGDVTGSGATAITTTLATVNANVGTFQGITVNGKGLVTAAVNQSYAPLASPTFTGTPAAPTATAGTNTTQIATTAFVATSFAPLASPTFTGTPAAPTATAGTNTTQIATTAFVATSFAPLASPALTGTPTAPTAALGTNTTQIATTAFVAAAFALPNRLDNGDMSIDQHNAGANFAASTAPKIAADRWQVYGSVASKYNAGRNYNGTTSNIANGFANFLGFQSSSAYTSAVGDQFAFWQAIEADTISDLNFGTAGALPVTLSFWVNSTLTGNFSGSLQNIAATRSYPFTFNIPSANTWTKISITIPGDTTGTWVTTGNGTSLTVYFDLGSGTTFKSSAGAWAAGNFSGVTGSVNLVATLNAKLSFTGVKLEAGSPATPWIVEPVEVRIARCQRYFCKSYDIASVPGAIVGPGAAQLQVPVGGTAGILQYIPFPVRMRADPTVTTYGPQSGASGQVRLSSGSDAASAVQGVGEGGCSIGYSGATSMGWINFHWIASAEL